MNIIDPVNTTLQQQQLHTKRQRTLCIYLLMLYNVYYFYKRRLSFIYKRITLE